MFVLFGTNNPKCNTVAFKGVTRIYTSIAPKDDKTKYIKIEDIESPMTPSSKPKENENTRNKGSTRDTSEIRSTRKAGEIREISRQ